MNLLNSNKLLLTLAGGALIWGCTTPKEAPEAKQSPGIALEYMDTQTSPKEDFFRYVNGKWIDKTEIPGDLGSWGSFNELREFNNTVVLDVLENASASGNYAEGSDQWKAAAFYKIGMDSLMAEQAGTQPLNAIFERIDAIQNRKDLQNYLAYQQQYGGGAFYSFSVFADLKNSSMNAAYLGQSGLGLPNKDYYTKNDERSMEIKERYIAHIARMLTLTGTPEDIAEAASESIMDMEMQLALASMDNNQLRNIPALYNKMTLQQVSEICPSINWQQYFKELGAGTVSEIIVTQPDFMQEVNKIVASGRLGDWKIYLKWHAINNAAGYLNNEIVVANFEFYSKELRGTEKMRSRWKRVLGSTNRVLGEAIGKLYVEETFPPEAKAAAKEMVDNIKLAYADRIKNLEWMSDSTKEMALKKLSTFTVKIGYPDTWKEYADLKVNTDPETSSFYYNILEGRKFNFQRNLEKLGKPVDKKEWGMTPQTVNAYYNPLNNEIVFPAAILQPPFFNFKADAAVNYGGIGAVIGHEISHGFDDQGSRFDSEGNMVNWWSDTDFKQFEARTQKLIDQYSAFQPLDSVFVDGKFTLGENIGDLGGISAAYDGLQRHISTHGNPGEIDGFSQEQRFFISWATIWRIKYRDEALRSQVQSDPHSPGMYRANGPISNLPTFYEAFEVQPGDAMYRSEEERVVIW